MEKPKEILKYPFEHQSLNTEGFLFCFKVVFQMVTSLLLLHTKCTSFAHSLKISFVIKNQNIFVYIDKHELEMNVAS